MSWRDRNASSVRATTSTMALPMPRMSKRVSDMSPTPRGLPPGLTRGMVAHRGLVHLHAPAGTFRHDQLAVLDCRRIQEQLVAPGDAVDVDLHDAEIRHDRAEMC